MSFSNGFSSILANGYYTRYFFIVFSLYYCLVRNERRSDLFTINAIGGMLIVLPGLFTFLFALPNQVKIYLQIKNKN